MSVEVVDTSGALWQIVHHELSHGGTADPSTLGFGTNIDGTPNRDIIVIPCPVTGCDGVSWWPRESLPPIVLEGLKA